MKKRIISFIMVLSVLCSMVADSSLVYAAYAPVVYTQADFDDLELVGETGAESYTGAIGQAPYLFWGKKGQMKEAVAPGGKAVGTSFTDLGAEDRALKWIIDDNASEDARDKVNMYMDISFPVSADVYGQREIAFSANLYYESYSGQGYLNCDLRNSYSKASENLFRIMSNGEIRGFRNDPGAKNYEGIGVTAYRPGKGRWFQIKAVINTKTLTYDFYLDGVKKNRESLPLVKPEMRFYGDPEENQNTNTITSIRLQMYDNANSIDQGVIYIDDIYVGEHVKNWDEPAEGPMFPAAADYPNDIAGVDESIFKNRELYRPLNTGFELLEETDAVAKNNANNQLAIVEDRHSGRFALKLLQNADEILPVKESDSFRITDIPTAVARVRAADDSYLPEMGQHEYKQNVVNIWVKPLYKAEELTFYTWMDITDNETTDEALVPIKSDKNGDGIYKLGEDFVQGKWQQIQVDLTKTESASIDGCAKGLYIKANIDSEWIFDDLTCDYLETHETEMDLNEFAGENIVNADGTLRFAMYNGAFDTAERVVKSKLDLNEKIVGVAVDSSTEILAPDEEQTDEAAIPVIDAPFSSDKWTVNDTDYDTQTGTSRKINAVQRRDIVPPSAYIGRTYEIQMERDKEQKYRFLLNKPQYYSVNITSGDITQSYGMGTPMSFYTKWLTDDAVVSFSANNADDGYFSFGAIEYEPVGESENKEITMKTNGTARLELGEITTQDRVTVSMSVQAFSNMDTENNRLMLSLIDSENTTYYSTYIALKGINGEQTVKAILPKIKENSILEIKNLASATFADSDYMEVRLLSFAMTHICEGDWNLEKKYAYAAYSSDTYYGANGTIPSYFTAGIVSELCTEENGYAVKHPDSKGVYNSSQADRQLDMSAYAVLRLLNLSNEPEYILIDGVKKWLDYGETDILYSGKNGGKITFPAGSAAMLLHRTNYSSLSPSATVIPYNYIDGLKDIYQLSDDGNLIYYANYYADKQLYSYNFVTKEYRKLVDMSVQSIQASNDFSHVLLQDDSGVYTLYDLKTGAHTALEESRTVQYYFAGNHLMKLTLEKYSTNTYYATVYQFINLKWVLVERYSGASSYNESYTGLSFDKNGGQMFFYYGTSVSSQNCALYSNYNNVWTKTKTYSAKTSNAIKKAFFSEDGSKIYFNDNACSMDLSTGLETGAVENCSELIKICDDGRFLVKYGSSGIYSLYDPVKNEHKKIAYSLPVFGQITYSSKNEIVTFRIANNMLARYVFKETEPMERYLLSFDGCVNWYAFKGGRWILASQDKNPTPEEMRAFGMRAAELNEIKPASFDKMYQNDTDVVTLHIAVYMNSNSNRVSPSIKSITVQTAANQVEERLTAAAYQGYHKADYRKINAIFPIENFRKPAECYYVLTLGNDWLYTYKNGKLVKLPLPADEIAEKVVQNWIKIKQYGMTASELRAVPEAALNDLLLNEDYANTEFGIIYVIRPDDYSTESYTVDFRIQADAQYFDYEELVMEITLNGTNMTFTTPDDLSKDGIDQFMSWLSGRQNGKGDIFYQLQTNKGQFFVNYFMISNVNVYNKENYNPVVPSAISKITNEQKDDMEQNPEENGLETQAEQE